MKLTRLVLLVFVMWTTLHVFAGSDLELSTNSTTPVYGRPFTLVCTVTGDALNDEAIKFARNNKTICKRRAYKSNTQTGQPIQCAEYHNTTQGYQCECDAVYDSKKVYHVTIKSFNAIDATQWFCISVSTSDEISLISNVVLFNIDECLVQTTCGTNANCTNTAGSYTCTCLNGYAEDGTECTDIDECREQATCGTNAICTNTAGSYTCTCLNGYAEDGTQCAPAPLKSTAIETVTIVLAATTTMLALLVIILVVVIIRMRSELADLKVTFCDIRRDDINSATSVYEDVHNNNTVVTALSEVPAESYGHGRSAPTGEHDYQNEQGLSGNNDQQTNTYERLDVDVTAGRGAYEKLNV